jgi:hypothetical protein
LITLSGRYRTDRGIVRPICFAVVKLIIRKDQQLFSNYEVSAQQVKRSVSRNWDLPTIQVSWRVRERAIIIFILVQY